MTTPRVPRPRSPRWRRRGRALLGAAPTMLAVATSIAVASGTAALWSATAVFDGGVFGAGDLTVRVGEVTWRQVTPGADPGHHGRLTQTPTGFVSMPGDVVQIRVPVTTTLRGDNLQGTLTARLTDPDPDAVRAAGSDVTVGFHIEDDDGAQVAPEHGHAAVGTVLSVPGMVGTAEGVTSTWTVVVTAQVDGGYRWAPPADAADPGTWSAGTITIGLDQVRAPHDRAEVVS